jgi:hypothetical protein
MEHLCACKRTANYGLPIPGTPPSHCAIHKSDDMIRKMYGMCTQNHCNQKAKYGNPFLGKTKCPAHKTNDMVNMEEYDRCTGKNGSKCTHMAVYGYVSPMRCAAHKENDMIDLIHNWCCHPGCTLQRTNTLGSKFCPAHQ